MPSAGYVPASLNMASHNGHVLQAQACITKIVSLSSLQYVPEYLLRMLRIPFTFSIISSVYEHFLTCPQSKSFSEGKAFFFTFLN